MSSHTFKAPLSLRVLPWQSSIRPTSPPARQSSKLRQVQPRPTPQESPELYGYNQIPSISSTIRLVELLPGDDTHIHSWMHFANLNNLSSFVIDGKRRSYEALSYTWDTQTLPNPIFCDSKILHVTQNVYDALHALRRATTSRMLWIDAICINQADIEERSHQVALMRLVYNRAALVISWIGKETENTALAFNMIDKIVSDHISADLSLKSAPEAIWDKRAMDAMGLPHFPSNEWAALAKIFESPYFRRIWVVQEVVVSSNAIVRCGQLTTRWDYVEYVARSLLSTGWVRALKQIYGSGVTPNFVQTISDVQNGFHELVGGQGIPLSLLLSATRRFLATDPRDKIIALVGMADHRSLGNSTSAMLDYSKSIMDLYVAVTTQLMRKEQSLNLLSSVEDGLDRRVSGLPSWVPDYSVGQRTTLLGSSIRVRHLNFHAAGRTLASIRWTSDSRVLAVDGFCHGEIEVASTESLEQHSEDMQLVLGWLQIAEPLIRRGIISIDAFWRTLIGDHGRHIYPAPDQYGTHFERYIQHANARAQGYPDMSRMDETTENHRAGNPLLYQAALGYLAPHRKFFRTKKGFIGLGPRSMRQGDLVCILHGGRVPFILRKEGSHYRLVGESYVHGIMEGEAMTKDAEVREFVIH